MRRSWGLAMKLTNSWMSKTAIPCPRCNTRWIRMAAQEIVQMSLGHDDVSALVKYACVCQACRHEFTFNRKEASVEAKRRGPARVGRIE